jgi:hypothetical protein
MSPFGGPAGNPVMPVKHNPKRIIYVGFLEPKVLEGRDIHVTLRPYEGTFEGGTVGARAFSAQDFMYHGKRVRGGSVGVSNMVERNHELRSCEPHYEIVLERLVRENRGEIVPRFFEDGIEILKRIGITMRPRD